jgi:hypothetical protein
MLLASLINGNYAHGLNTASYLEDDLDNDIYSVNNGKINFKPNNYPPEFKNVGL